MLETYDNTQFQKYIKIGEEEIFQKYTCRRKGGREEVLDLYL